VHAAGNIFKYGMGKCDTSVTHQRVRFAWRRGICMCHLCGVKGGAKKHIKIGVWHVHKVYNKYNKHLDTTQKALKAIP
jgi:hypothetical protein